MRGPEEFTLTSNGGVENLRGFVEAPGSVHKRHECPPDRVAMALRLEEIEKAFTRRLTHQRQVIENLDMARKRAEKDLALWHDFARHLTSLEAPVFADLRREAEILLAQQGVEE